MVLDKVFLLIQLWEVR